MSVNKPGARLVSEAALIAYQRGGGATVIETPTAVVGGGGVHIAPVGAAVAPAEKPKRGRGFRLVGLGCIGAVILVVALIVMAAIFGSSDSGSPAPPRRSSGSDASMPNNDLVSPCQLLIHAIADNEKGDIGAAESSLIAWTLTLKGTDENVLGFSGLRERELYREVRDAPIGDETGRSVDRLVEFCLNLYADE